MPFDGTDFPHRRRRPRGRPNEAVLRVALVVGAVVLLVLPVSLNGMVDLIRYFHRP